MAEVTIPQIGARWKPGQSGNPAGRPRGQTPSRALSEVLNVLVQKAKAGDTQSAALVLDFFRAQI